MEKVFLFDFDGTLIDTMEGYADIAGEVINRFNSQISFEEARRLYIETSGIPFCQQIEIIMPNNPANQEIVNFFEKTKIEGMFKTKPTPELYQAIEKIKRTGKKVCISSGNFVYLINKYLEQENLSFDLVLGFDEEKGFEKGKPHFDYIIKHFNLKKEELTFVGDSLKDAEKALDYGIPFIGKTGLFSRDQFLEKYPKISVIDRLSELA